MSSKKKSPIKVHKSVRPLVEKALAMGWSVEWSKNNHLKFTHPKGGMVFHSGTPGDHRAVKNAESRLRRLAKTGAGQ